MNDPQFPYVWMGAYTICFAIRIYMIINGKPLSQSLIDIYSIFTICQYSSIKYQLSSPWLIHLSIPIYLYYYTNQICSILLYGIIYMKEARASDDFLSYIKNSQAIIYHYVISNQCISSKGKSYVLITIDLPLRPALNAMLFTSLNRLSTIPFTPSKAEKGGTAPGTTPSFFTSSYEHILLFFANNSTFLSLLQLILRFARYNRRNNAYLPVTNIVFEPHQSGVFLSSADSCDVRVAACSITSNLTPLEERYEVILLNTTSFSCSRF